MSEIYQSLSGLPHFRCLGEADAKEVELAEVELGLAFDKDYKEYLEACSFASMNGHELTGLCKFPRLDVVSVTRKECEANPGIDPTWYVVERTGMDGVAAWQDQNGAIYLVSPGPECAKVSDSLVEYVSK